MARKQRIPKPKERLFTECETHLHFLRDALRLYREDENRINQIAGELRVLVGDHSPKKRLLLQMMDEYGFGYEVQPPGPPFDKQPIATIGWRDDPSYQTLTEELAAAVGDEIKLAECLEKQAALRCPMPFDEYVDKALAVYMAPHDYSFRQLVNAVAQQSGSSHEDTAIEVPLAQMENTRLAGRISYAAAPEAFTELVLHVGSLLIKHVAESYDYKPQYFVEPE